jgi:hypothetical protein
MIDEIQSNIVLIINLSRASFYSLGCSHFAGWNPFSCGNELRYERNIQCNATKNLFFFLVLPRIRLAYPITHYWRG